MVRSVSIQPNMCKHSYTRANSFRSASTMPSVMRRMCHVDRLGEVKDRRSMSKQKKDDDDHHLGVIYGYKAHSVSG